MDTMTLQVETDSEGAAVAVGSVSPRRVYAIGWDGTDLGTDATMTLVATVPLAGDATLLSLADADTSGLVLSTCGRGGRGGRGLGHNRHADR